MSKANTTTALTLPDPEQSSLPAIRSKCREIYDRRDEVIGVWDLQVANAYRRGMSAIEKFVGNRDGRDDVRRSARILECAVGAALGPAPNPAMSQRTDLNHSLANEGCVIPADDRYRCRLLFKYRDVWESVLVERGLSRAQALTLIKDYLWRAEALRKGSTAS